MPPVKSFDLEFSRQAQNDLLRFYRFYADQNLPDVGRRALTTIRSSLNRLTAMPLSGRPANETGLREWLVAFGKGGYVVLYYADTKRKCVEILKMKSQAELDYHNGGEWDEWFDDTDVPDDFLESREQPDPQKREDF